MWQILGNESLSKRLKTLIAFQSYTVSTWNSEQGKNDRFRKRKNWVTFGSKSSKQYLSSVIYYSQKEECVNNAFVFDLSSSNYDARYA